MNVKELYEEICRLAYINNYDVVFNIFYDMEYDSYLILQDELIISKERRRELEDDNLIYVGCLNGKSCYLCNERLYKKFDMSLLEDRFIQGDRFYLSLTA